MLAWFKDKFLFNHQLARSVRDLEFSLRLAEGQVTILQQWNEESRKEIRELKTIIYTKYGLIESSTEQLTNQKPIQRLETWRTARSKLEERWTQKEEDAIAKGELNG